ncbi:hypothetical protein EVAR_45374_1 [Eumeta japonica]|uniref:Mariner Mos1 transposase n=1 Tax=Eumeta variegata TaxID=151549 RepID=A0A4C1XWZ8_EUMVA|nr:hypothetical protein EVAR_45374_1 [Eumeta japonica]
MDNLLLHVMFLNYVNCLGIDGFSYGYKIVETKSKQPEFTSSGTTAALSAELSLDDFDANEKRIWSMKYIQRANLWRPYRSIYIFTNDKAEATPAFLKGDMMYAFANETDCAMFMSEYSQDWFKDFQLANFDVKDEPRSSQPVTDKVDAILEKSEQDRHISSYNIAEELELEHKTVLTHLKKA